jgi:plastocyanin
MKRLLLLVLLAALVAAIGACGGGDDDNDDGASSGSGATADQPVITIKGFAFSGATSTKVNTQVTIKNEDSTKHTFTPDHAGDFQAAVLEGGQESSVQFAEAGTFAYHCEIHGSMKGSIEVTA